MAAFETLLAFALANDPVMAAICRQVEEDEQREQMDIARLDKGELASYQLLRARPMSHGDAVWYVDAARRLSVPR